MKLGDASPEFRVLTFPTQLSFVMGSTQCGRFQESRLLSRLVHCLLEVWDWFSLACVTSHIGTMWHCQLSRCQLFCKAAKKGEVNMPLHALSSNWQDTRKISLEQFCTLGNPNMNLRWIYLELWHCNYASLTTIWLMIDILLSAENVFSLNWQATLAVSVQLISVLRSTWQSLFTVCSATRLSNLFDSSSSLAMQYHSKSCLTAV